MMDKSTRNEGEYAPDSKSEESAAFVKGLLARLHTSEDKERIRVQGYLSPGEHFLMSYFALSEFDEPDLAEQWLDGAAKDHRNMRETVATARAQFLSSSIRAAIRDRLAKIDPGVFSELEPYSDVDRSDDRSD